MLRWEFIQFAPGMTASHVVPNKVELASAKKYAYLKNPSKPKFMTTLKMSHVVRFHVSLRAIAIAMPQSATVENNSRKTKLALVFQ